MKNTIIALAASAIALGSVNAQQLTGNLLNGAELVNNGSFTFTAADGSTGTAFLTVTPSNSDVLLSASNATDFSASGGNTAGGDLPTVEIHNTVWTLTFDVPVVATVDIFQVNHPDEEVTFSGSPLVTLNSDHILTGNALTESNPGALGVSSTLLEYNRVSTITITNNNRENSTPVGLLSSFRVQVQSAVPEPSSALLLGLSALGFIGRRKR